MTKERESPKLDDFSYLKKGDKVWLRPNAKALYDKDRDEPGWTKEMTELLGKELIFERLTKEYIRARCSGQKDIWSFRPEWLSLQRDWLNIEDCKSLEPGSILRVRNDVVDYHSPEFGYTPYSAHETLARKAGKIVELLDLTEEGMIIAKSDHEWSWSYHPTQLVVVESKKKCKTEPKKKEKKTMPTKKTAKTIVAGAAGTNLKMTKEAAKLALDIEAGKAGVVFVREQIKPFLPEHVAPFADTTEGEFVIAQMLAFMLQATAGMHKQENLAQSVSEKLITYATVSEIGKFDIGNKVVALAMAMGLDVGKLAGKKELPSAE